MAIIHFTASTDVINIPHSSSLSYAWLVLWFFYRYPQTRTSFLLPGRTRILTLLHLMSRAHEGNLLLGEIKWRAEGLGRSMELKEFLEKTKRTCRSFWKRNQGRPKMQPREIRTCHQKGLFSGVLINEELIWAIWGCMKGMVTWHLTSTALSPTPGFPFPWWGFTVGNLSYALSWALGKKALGPSQTGEKINKAHPT